MSEAEKRRRFYYKQNRNKWIRIGALILAAAVLITVVFAAIFFSMDSDTFISYTEKGDIDYSVILKNNDIFDSNILDSDNMYVSSLIQAVTMDFEYSLAMEQEAVFTYSYDVDANIVIKDRTTKKLIYKGRLTKDAEALFTQEDVTLENPSRTISIKQPITVDYASYNTRAMGIVQALTLKDVTCTLEVEMSMHVKGAVADAEQSKENTYNMALSMPLDTDKTSFSVNSAIPTGENKLIVTNEDSARIVFLIIAIVFLVLTLIFAVLFVAFIYLTRNTDINYNIRVKKIVSNYKSYIQKIVSPFDRTGYQLLVLNEFTELLEIRDTIQSPILMNENEDKTCTTFMIPTNTKLLYVFEVKVADYEELYRKVEEGEETPITTDELPEIIEEIDEIEETEATEEAVEAENSEENELVLLEDVDEEELAVAIALPDVALEEIDYDEDDDSDDEEEGVEVIGVVWPEQETHNKVYRYDPNGERVTKGDIVLVPSNDALKEREIVRKATVAHGNHKVDPENLTHPLKKIIGVFKRKAEELLMPKDEILEEELPVTEEVLETEEIPVVEELPVTEEIPAEEPAVPVDLHYDDEEIATAESMDEEPPVTEETPATEEAEVTEETPVTEEAEVAEETPVTEETEVAEETPAAEETEAAEEVAIS